METYVFDDALTGARVACRYPNISANIEPGAAQAEAESVFFPGCSFINYMMPLVKPVADLLEQAGVTQGTSLLCCGKILEYEPDGAAVRAAFLFLLAEPLPQTLFDMALGALAVPGALLLLSLAMDKVLGRESLGGGDIKLLFVLGLYLGWAEMLLLLLAACILGILWALRPGKKNAAIPFAPFLSAAAILVTIFGSGLVEWYLGLL